MDRLMDRQADRTNQYAISDHVELEREIVLIICNITM
jgi:hypothetical protein